MSAIETSRRTVLIAEDDPVSRRILEVLLEKWGYDAVATDNGKDAFDRLLCENAPRMAILDWMMPGMEGIDICRRLRERPGQPYVYILLVSARSEREDLLSALHAGADDYLVKPFDSRELQARLVVGQRILNLQDELIGTREELRYRATHDALTGIYNRAEIVDAVSREEVRQRRERGTFAIVLIDLDRFKEVNDTFGHLAGDFVLREASHRMASCIRPYDMLGRYGGEEFLILSPATDSRGALCLAERVRLAISGTPVDSPYGPVLISASLGVSVSSGQDPHTSDQLLQLADAALYRAKSQGRNRVELALPPVALPSSRRG